MGLLVEGLDGGEAGVVAVVEVSVEGEVAAPEEELVDKFNICQPCERERHVVFWLELVSRLQ